MNFRTLSLINISYYKDCFHLNKILIWIRPRPICKDISRPTHSTSVRVRFAPSPTGYLHLGGLRTALYNYLYARSHKGSFILRIEDTDQARTIPDSIESIERDLAWTSILPDESPSQSGIFGPYTQSQRNHLYKSHIDFLIQNGLAYRCFCSSDRLQALRQLSKGISYDNKCRSLTSSEADQFQNNGISFCVRFKVNIHEIVPFNDLIFGFKQITLSGSEGDFILLKSDGTPTYHFANVVDDHLMKISHVLRGNEWLSSVPKHLLLYKAFGWNAPLFGHLPQLLNEDGTKLSKRQNDLHIKELRQQGFSPETLINFITSIGGGFKHGGEAIKTLDELIKKFDIELLGTNSYRLEMERLFTISRLDFQKKLSNPLESEVVIQQLRAKVLQKLQCIPLDVTLSDAYLKSILNLYRDRVDKWPDLTDEKYNYLWMKPQPELIKKGFSELNLNAEQLLAEVLSSLSKLNPREFKEEKIKDILLHLKVEHKLKNVHFMKLLRIALCGVSEGPSVAEIFNILGQIRSIQRINDALQFA